METQKVLNQTAKNEEINSGQESKIDLKNEIYPVWQGLEDGNITFTDELDFDPAELDTVYKSAKLAVSSFIHL